MLLLQCQFSLVNNIIENPRLIFEFLQQVFHVSLIIDFLKNEKFLEVENNVDIDKEQKLQNFIGILLRFKINLSLSRNF